MCTPREPAGGKRPKDGGEASGTAARKHKTQSEKAQKGEGSKSFAHPNTERQRASGNRSGESMAEVHSLRSDVSVDSKPADPGAKEDELLMNGG